MFVSLLQTITRSLIVKAALSSGLAFKTLSAHNVYNKEIEFYSEIVPQIRRLSRKLDEPIDFFAETIGVCKLNKVMLFEDLIVSGFGMASIQKGFDVPEAKAVLEKLAKFHAICAVLQEEKPNVFINFKYGKTKPFYPFISLSLSDILMSSNKLKFHPLFEQIKVQ